MNTAFEIFKHMQQQLHQEETQQAEQRLVNDGTWGGLLTSWKKIDVSKLPHADVVGYNLTYTVDEQGVEKRVYFDVYFTPVMGTKGLDFRSRMGTQLCTIMGMSEGETFEDVLTRAQGMGVDLRITRKAASNGYKPKNAVWDIKARH